MGPWLSLLITQFIIQSLKFCLKLFDYMVLFEQATSNASTDHMPAHTIILDVSSSSLLTKLHNYM